MKSFLLSIFFISFIVVGIFIINLYRHTHYSTEYEPYKYILNNKSSVVFVLEPMINIKNIDEYSTYYFNLLLEEKNRKNLTIKNLTIKNFILKDENNNIIKKITLMKSFYIELGKLKYINYIATGEIIINDVKNTKYNKKFNIFLKPIYEKPKYHGIWDLLMSV